MNAAPVSIQQHVSCNTVGTGRCFTDSAVKLDVKVRSLSDSFKLDKDIIKLPKLLKKKSSLSNSSCSSSTTDSASSLDSSLKKSVTFATDKKGRVLCETYKNTAPRTKAEALDCWYTVHDFRHFRRDCKQQAVQMQKTAYRKNFAAVYEACAKGSFKGVTKERAYISAASCRGLEVVVFPTLHANRKNALKTILQTQSSLPKGMSFSKREDALASSSRFLTKQARQLARVLGSGDAAVVVANNRIAANKKAANKETKLVPQCYI